VVLILVLAWFVVVPVGSAVGVGVVSLVVAR
jgi:hypothetical protein